MDTAQALGEEAGVTQAQRPQHEHLDGALVRRVRDHLDHAAGQIHCGVVVGENLAQRGELRQRAHPGDVLCERVVAGSVSHVIVAEPAGTVVEELPHRHAPRDRLVGELEAGEIRANRRVEIYLALLDEPHHGGAGKRLRDRADAKERIAVDGDRTIDVRLAIAAYVLTALVKNGDGDARHLVALHRGLDALVELAEERRVGGCSGGRRRHQSRGGDAGRCAEHVAARKHAVVRSRRTNRIRLVFLRRAQLGSTCSQRARRGIASQFDFMPALTYASWPEARSACTRCVPRRRATRRVGCGDSFGTDTGARRAARAWRSR